MGWFPRIAAKIADLLDERIACFAAYSRCDPKSRAPPSRPQTVTWNGMELDHTHSPVYLGITLNRSLTYRNHCLKNRAKLSSRNNLLRELHGTNWTRCIRPTAAADLYVLSGLACGTAKYENTKCETITLNVKKLH